MQTEHFKIVSIGKIGLSPLKWKLDFYMKGLPYSGLQKGNIREYNIFETILELNEEDIYDPIGEKKAILSSLNSNLSKKIGKK